MAYPYFPAGYQPYQPFYQPQQAPQQAQVQAQTKLVEIMPTDSVDNAAAWPVQVGSSQIFVARDDSFIAVKSVGVSGDSSFAVYDKRPPAPPEPKFDPGAYVRRDEMESLVLTILHKEGGPANESV